MYSIKKFVFNPFQVNTFLISNDDGISVVIDPGMNEPEEKEAFDAFVEENNLRPAFIINTHCHIDHVLGNEYITGKYGAKLLIHEKSLPYLRNAPYDGEMFGFRLEPYAHSIDFLNADDGFNADNIHFNIRYTPGHVDGSICLVNHDMKVVFAGDVLFRGSIGRTDLPSGNYDLLIDSIQRQLLSLDDDYTVYSGHGPETTIGDERRHNPFLI